MSTTHETHLEVTSTTHPKVQEVDEQGNVLAEKDLSHVISGLKSTIKSSRTSGAAKVRLLCELAAGEGELAGTDVPLKCRNPLRRESISSRRRFILLNLAREEEITRARSINIECELSSFIRSKLDWSCGNEQNWRFASCSSSRYNFRRVSSSLEAEVEYANSF